MILPTWSEFTAKLSQVEQDINQKVQKFKNDHPILNKAIKMSISFFPPPFDSIANKIYDSFDGSEEEKSAAVLNYFKYLQSQGEKHYNTVTSQLNGILNEIQDVKTITAKQSSVDKIQEILTSTGNATNQKLNELVNDVKGMVIKVDLILTSVNQILGQMKGIEPKWTYGTLDVRISDFQSLIPDLTQIQDSSGVDYAIFDLGGGNGWLSTRLYLFTLMHLLHLGA